MKKQKNKVAIEGGTTNLHIEFDVPVSIIVKEKSSGSPDSNPLYHRGTYGWKFSYMDRTFGDYVYIVDDVSDLEDPVTKQILEEVYEMSIEYAEDIFIHRALLVDTFNKSLIDELDYRLTEKYYPIHATSGNKYILRGSDGKVSGTWHKKFSVEYTRISIRNWFTHFLLRFVSKLLD